MSLRDIANTTADETEANRKAEAAAYTAARARSDALQAEFCARITELNGIEYAECHDGSGYFGIFTAPESLSYYRPWPYLMIEMSGDAIRFNSTNYYGEKSSFKDYMSVDEAARAFAHKLGVYAGYGKAARAKGREPDDARKRYR